MVSVSKNITRKHWASNHPTHSVRVTVATLTTEKSVRLRVEIVRTSDNRCLGIHRNFFMGIAFVSKLAQYTQFLSIKSNNI